MEREDGVLRAYSPDGFHPEQEDVTPVSRIDYWTSVPV
jgi:hypothetical protein